MNKSLKRIALGTTALSFFMIEAVLAQVPPELLNPSSSRWEMGPLGVPVTFSTKLRVIYDSNICENYNSGSFFLPNPGNYDQRMVDETMDHIDKLNDDEFIALMDWIDGSAPAPWVLRDSPLGRAMDDIDWMTEAEIDEVWSLTADRDFDLWFGPPRLKISFSGIFARALEQPPIKLGLGPRFSEPTYFSFGYTPPAPTLTIQQGLNEADLENLKNFFNETDAKVTPPGPEGGDYSFALPNLYLNNLDRFQIKAGYNYAIDNKVTDGSLPAVTRNTPGTTTLPEEGDYPIGFDADPFLNYVGNFLKSGATSPSADGVNGNLSTDYDTPYLDELTREFEQALTDDMAISLTGFYKKTHELAEVNPGLSVNPSWLRFQYDQFSGGMTEIPPSTLNLDPSDLEPIESVIPELYDPFRIEGHIGKDQVDAQSTIEPLSNEAPLSWDLITPRIGLTYDLGGNKSLTIPLNYFYGSSTTENNTTTTNDNNTTTQERPKPTQTSSNIKFKIEESVFENNQVNTNPAQEVLVKLGFPIPPMPIDGNPRIDAGASDDPVQGEVDSEGNLNLNFDFKENFGIGIRAEYDYSGFDETEIGDGSPPTLTLDEPATSADSTGTDSSEEWTYDPNMIRLRIDFGGGNTRIDPPTLDLTAGPSNEPIQSVIPELQSPPVNPPMGDANGTSTNGTGGDTRLQGRQSDINWQDVQNALGEFADIPALDRMRNRDVQHEGGPDVNETTTPNTTNSGDGVLDLENALKNSVGNGTTFNPESGLKYKISEYQSAVPSDRIYYNYNYFNNTPVTNNGLDAAIRYDTPSFGPLRIGSGIRGEPSGMDMDINMNKLESRILFSDGPLGGLGGFSPFNPRYFKIKNNYLTSIFFSPDQLPLINDLVESTPSITKIRPNPYRGKQGDDPYFKSEGTWGQNYADQWAIQHVGFTEEDTSAWAAAGNELEEVIVAVIDTGIDWNHADISWDTIWRNQRELPDNGVDDDGNGYIDDLVGWDFFLYNNLPWDEDGHGTFVTGIIAASSDNNTGISGINPAAKIMVIKALDSFGHTRASYLSEAIAYAVDNGARIINLSVGGNGLSEAEELAVNYAEESGVLIFAAAGNTGAEASNFGFVPYETVVTVGSTTNQDAKSNFSNWGEGIDIMAPGEDILSLRARRTDLMLNVRHLDYEMGASYVGNDKRYYRAAGTSFSVPIVAGIASLILSKNPDLTPAEVRRMLYQSAKDIDVPGRDQLTGFGLVDAAGAINADPAFEIIADISGVEVIQEKGNVFVSIKGTANANDFDGAEIFIGRGENPESWKSVGEKVKKPVLGGVLTKVPAAEFQGAPVWIIRIVVTHENGRTREERFTLTLG